VKLHHLRDFVAVARTGGLRPAARELGLSQPALSKSIRQLEAELGTPLFERTARGSQLNPYGRAFLARAERVESELIRGRDELAQMRGSTAGRVAFAVSGTPALLFLPQALRSFRRRFPDAEVRINEGTVATLHPALADGALDFVIGPTPWKPLGPEFVADTLFHASRDVIARRGHPLSRARSLADLIDQEWILTGAADRAAELERPFRDHRLDVPQRTVRCESLLAVLSLLANSDAFAFLPQQWSESPIVSHVLARVPVRERIPGPPICLIRRRGLPLTPAADALAAALAHEAEVYAAQLARDGATPRRAPRRTSR
jgi:DNA-binding transcriptional LysR family regulator